MLGVAWGNVHGLVKAGASGALWPPRPESPGEESQAGEMWQQKSLLGLRTEGHRPWLA